MSYNEIKALLRAKSKDYLLGYIDCMIQMKNQMGYERLDLNEKGMTASPEQNHILGPVYLDLTCPCGNYVAFKTGNEIPEKSFKCPLCEKIYMIYYEDEFK
jgi:hypothetical protein